MVAGRPHGPSAGELRPTPLTTEPSVTLDVHAGESIICHWFNVPEDLAPDELTAAKAIELMETAAPEERVLGTDPHTGHTVVAKNGRYGAYVKKGGFGGVKMRAQWAAPFALLAAIAVPGAQWLHQAQPAIPSIVRYELLIAIAALVIAVVILLFLLL